MKTKERKVNTSEWKAFRSALKKADENAPNLLRTLSGLGEFNRVHRCLDGKFIGRKNGEQMFSHILPRPEMKAFIRVEEIISQLNDTSKDIAKMVLRRNRLFI